MSALPATGPTYAGVATPMMVVADDPGDAHDAGALLRAAGFAVRERDAGEAAVVVLVLSSDAAERVVLIAAQAEARPEASIVATMPTDAAASLLRRAMRAGADGIVLDGELAGALVPTVRAVLVGQLAVPRVLGRRIAPRPLSFREKQILSLVVQGFTNRQIADRLFLAESTVKTHLSSAFGKLDAHSRAEAAALVLDPDAGFDLGLPALATESAA